MSDNIKLQATLAEPVEVFGYYRTFEGRKFLRELYGPFAARSGLGDGKIASIIADIPMTHSEDEAAITKAALVRWRDGQSELWAKDAEKTARVMRRLEAEMMTLSELREILEDRAATIYRRDIGNSLAMFHQGIGGGAVPRANVDELLNELKGAFLEQARDGPIMGTSPPLKSLYHFYMQPADVNFLIVHEFSLKLTSKGARVHRLHSGYAVPSRRGTVARFMVNIRHPTARYFDEVHFGWMRDHEDRYVMATRFENLLSRRHSRRNGEKGPREQVNIAMEASLLHTPGVIEQLMEFAWDIPL